MGEFDKIKSIRDFKSMVKYLRTELDWPIDERDAENLTFEYTPAELGLDEKAAVKIEEIKQIKPLVVGQPWGVFWIEFETKRLPVTVMRRILAALVKTKRGSKDSDRAAWEIQDLLFISATGEENDRGISFAHFRQVDKGLPQLRTFYWDTNERHFYYIKNLNLAALHWPTDVSDKGAWEAQWAGAFTAAHREVITKSHDLAVQMAELAAAMRDLVIEVYDNEIKKGPLHGLFDSFKELLIHDLKVDDFADMYAQTITYGLFSAAITQKDGKFDLERAIKVLPNTSHFLQDLLAECLRVGSVGHLDVELDELGVAELVATFGRTNMEAIRHDFGKTTGGEDPVIQFYETFLMEYDPEKKIQRGVFFTPWPVVSYIVRSVDEILRTEFGLEDGLADTTTWGEMAKRHKDIEIPHGVSPDQDFIQILDPATGTGTFLVEAIEVIHTTLVDKWKSAGNSDAQIDSLWNEYVPEHLLSRLCGFEILMAPYAIAHLKVGLKLYETGYRFGRDERVRVYLTNSLGPVAGIQQMRLEGFLPAMAREASDVNAIKHKMRYSVIVGNPPYSKSSQTQNEWIADLMEAYKTTVRKAETQIQALSDDYAKFLRLAHYLLEKTGTGVVGFVTNNGFLDGPLFRDMRGSLMQYFTKIRILNLHGDSRKKFTPPDGTADENVFDIQQGVGISVFCRPPSLQRKDLVDYAEMWGSRERKYGALLQPVAGPSNFELLYPRGPHFLFVPVERGLQLEFNSGWHPYQIFGTGNLKTDNHSAYGAGFVTQQDRFAIGFEASDVATNVADFLDSEEDKGELFKKYGFCSTNQWNFERARRELKGLEIRRMTERCLYRPFDFRFTVFDRNICTIVRKRITHQFDQSNIGLLLTRRVTRPPFNNVFVSNCYTEYKVASHDRNTIVFPLWIYPDRGRKQKLMSNGPELNLNQEFVDDLAYRLGLDQPGPDGLPADVEPLDIFHYIYAVFYSPTYRVRYEEFLKIDFPRLHQPGSLDFFFSLASLGDELVSLHVMATPRLDLFVSEYEGPSKPEVGRVGWSEDTVWLDAKKTNARQGHRATKPGTIGFKGVPEEVWDFHIGGYQVCHKWLKDRKGRTLSDEDVAHYQKIIVAISETMRIMGEIDEVIEKHGGWPDAFVTDTSNSEAVEYKMAAERGEEYGAGSGKRKRGKSGKPKR